VRIVVLAAHPDDETLGAGGIISAAGDRGHPVEVVIATDGAASHPTSPTHTPPQLAAIRRQEAWAAVHELNAGASLRLLGLPDGAMDEHEDVLARILHHVAQGPTRLFTTWFDDRHPDHRACSAAARAVAGRRTDVEVWEFPIWAWHWGDPAADDLPAQQSRRIPITPSGQHRRAQALRRYPSQFEPLSDQSGDEPVLSSGFLAHFDRPFDVVIAPPEAGGPAALGPAFASQTSARAGVTGYFDDLYAHADDPWGLADRWYEHRKRELLLAALPRPRFRRAFEPGCAIGLLTEQLIGRCDEVIAADAADRAVELTRERVTGLGQVTVSRMSIPTDWPTGGSFDLIVLSEVAYYVERLEELAQRLRDSLDPDGIVVLCHWRHAAPDHPHTAWEVHRELPLLAGLSRLVRHEEDDFLLDVVGRRPESVAVREGIVSAGPDR
jgi:LmbE family N-acetylglucosaminyl deacetylase/SAM-dependent methyltransferase